MRHARNSIRWSSDQKIPSAWQAQEAWKESTVTPWRLFSRLVQALIGIVLRLRRSLWKPIFCAYLYLWTPRILERTTAVLSSILVRAMRMGTQPTAIDTPIHKTRSVVTVADRKGSVRRQRLELVVWPETLLRHPICVVYSLAPLTRYEPPLPRILPQYEYARDVSWWLSGPPSPSTTMIVIWLIA